MDEEAKRFKFGKNWASFLDLLNEERILAAQKSLQSFLRVNDLESMTFLDVGSGSGLFSLAARKLGAEVHSFDFDQDSVNCTVELKRRFYPHDQLWTVEKGSVLDIDYLGKLEEFDIVYSWGVLHHTGAMWLAIENALQKVKLSGHFYIALYNDQGLKSRIWWCIKYLYNKLPSPFNALYALVVGFFAHLLNVVFYTIRLQPMTAVRAILIEPKKRGMSFIYDLFDWVGGFPFEYVQYDVMCLYMQRRGFELVNGQEVTTLGCHEFLFKRLR